MTGTAFTQNTFNSYGYSRGVLRRDGRPPRSQRPAGAATSDRSEVTAGQKYQGTDTSDKTNPVTAYDYDYDYDYDNIGNHETYDANGNVSEYLDDNGAISAHYEYSPFGKLTVASGTKAADFDHRFSTKYLDTATELYYYGQRYYSPELGRWNASLDQADYDSNAD